MAIETNQDEPFNQKDLIRLKKKEINVLFGKKTMRKRDFVKSFLENIETPMN